MSRFKLMSAGAAGIALLGAVVMLFLPRLGGALMGLSLVALVLVGTWETRRMAGLQATMHRNSKEFHRLEKDALARLEQKVKKILDGAPTSATPGAQSQPASLGPRPPAALAGRAATPHVTNTATELTLTKVTDPAFTSRRRVAIGVVSPSLRERLEGEGITVHLLRRGAVSEQLGATEAATLVIDEDAFAGGDWFGLLDAPGAGRAKELVDGLRLAQSRGMLVVLVPASRQVPHVNSAALRVRGVTVLPLDEAAWAEANEAPLTGSVLPLLQQVASHRSEVPA